TRVNQENRIKLMLAVGRERLEEQSAPEQKPAAQMTVVNGGKKRPKPGSTDKAREEFNHRIAV
ncbi:MAG: hypothetical protein II379_03360, partial [Oscillospiraceae bacterium]|nr:hypothetical protein [Oscillospiraceae bacterium]